MNAKGFSLLELLTVIAITGILLAIGSLYFTDMYKRSRIERQTKEMFADLMGARAQALYQKTDRSVTLSSTQYTISPWQEGAGSASVLRKDLGFPVVFSSGFSGSFYFDSQRGGVASATLCICVDPSSNTGSVDSLLISPTSITMGKRNMGGDCVVSQIAVQ